MKISFDKTPRRAFYFIFFSVNEEEVFTNGLQASRRVFYHQEEEVKNVERE